MKKTKKKNLYCFFFHLGFKKLFKIFCKIICLCFSLANIFTINSISVEKDIAEIICCYISKKNSSLYFGLDVFCLVDARATEFDQLS